MYLFRQATLFEVGLDLGKAEAHTANTVDSPSEDGHIKCSASWSHITWEERHRSSMPLRHSAPSASFQRNSKAVYESQQRTSPCRLCWSLKRLIGVPGVPSQVQTLESSRIELLSQLARKLFWLTVDLVGFRAKMEQSTKPWKPEMAPSTPRDMRVSARRQQKLEKIMKIRPVVVVVGVVCFPSRS